MKYKGHFHVHHETHDTQFILYQLSNRSLIRLAFFNNSHSTPSTHLRNAVGFGRTGLQLKPQMTHHTIFRFARLVPSVL